MNAMNGRLARTLAAATAAIMLLLAGGAISLAADPIVVWCEPQKQATIQAVSAEMRFASYRSIKAMSTVCIPWFWPQ